ncbi:hypothetical protein VNO78_03211 [Psophocarpus tetragonolobus]|uniref:DNA polymerase delta subunit 4 n=1 Tax=Psophocarpus tetragonolobus TaxID=3891 RepID=A0AAN9T3Y2_PSOTE
MKKYYRQRKNTAKKSSSISRKKKSKVVKQHPENDCSSEEQALKIFDMNMMYGPCLGMPRLERWERAQKMGLKPPEEIKCFLESGKVQRECLWHKLTPRRETFSIRSTPEGTSYIERIYY